MGHFKSGDIVSSLYNHYGIIVYCSERTYDIFWIGHNQQSNGYPKEWIEKSYVIVTNIFQGCI